MNSSSSVSTVVSSHSQAKKFGIGNVPISSLIVMESGKYVESMQSFKKKGFQSNEH